MIDLKKCCGKNPRVRIASGDGILRMQTHLIICKECGSRTPEFLRLSDCADYWNSGRRAR